MWIIHTFGVVASIAVITLWYCAVGDGWKTNLDTVFSGLAFVGIVYSVLFQGKEIKITQKELERSASAHIIYMVAADACMTADACS